VYRLVCKQSRRNFVICREAILPDCRISENLEPEPISGPFILKLRKLASTQGWQLRRGGHQYWCLFRFISAFGEHRFSNTKITYHCMYRLTWKKQWRKIKKKQFYVLFFFISRFFPTQIENKVGLAFRSQGKVKRNCSSCVDLTYWYRGVFQA